MTSYLITAVLLALSSAGVYVQAANISGVVADQNGKPISSARIDNTGIFATVPFNDGSGSPGDGPGTDVRGAFAVSTNSPFIVIRKPGYESVRLHVVGDETLHVVLRPIRAEACRVETPKWKRKFSQYGDHRETRYVVRLKNGDRVAVVNGRSFIYPGFPPEDRVFSSVEYWEVMYADGVIDARGRDEHGYWRSKTIFGTTIGFTNVDLSAAQQLDCVMGLVPFQRLEYSVD